MSNTLPFPTDYTPELIHYAVSLLEKVYRPGMRFQKCGVMLMDLSPVNRERRDMLDNRDQGKLAKLMKAVDAINGEYGTRTLHFGSLGNCGDRKPGWGMRAALKSPKYTTDWGEILEIGL